VKTGRRSRSCESEDLPGDDTSNVFGEKTKETAATAHAAGRLTFIFTLVPHEKNLHTPILTVLL
jgi:hypothetical protein